MWHNLPAETDNEPRTGLTGTTFTLVKETEAEVKRKYKEYDAEVVKEKLTRLFFKDQCRHCRAPRCKYACPKKAITIDSGTGAVVIDQAKCDPGLITEGGCATESSWGVKKYPCVERCWYHIPHLDAVKNKMRKCDFCYDRIRERKDGSPRATTCADACPSGAIFFGTPKEVNAEATARLAKVKTRYPDARIGGFVATPLVKWILLGAPKLYGLAK
jgi:formate dehydrogenase iron-sulfur subunit